MNKKQLPPFQVAAKLLVLCICSLLTQSSFAQLSLNWGTGLGNINQDFSNSMVVDATGNIYISGYISDTVDFDPSVNQLLLGSDMAPDAFLAKYDPSGNLIWAKHIEGSTMPVFSEDIAVDGQGDVYLTGYFGGTVDFDPGTATSNLTASGPFDVYLVKIDASGNFQWAHNFGGPSADFGYGLATDASDHVIITGYYLGSADFDPSANTATLNSVGNSPDTYLAKYTSSGALVWANSLGGSVQDQGNAIATDAQDNIYVTGFFGSSADFDPSAGTANLTSAGAADIFLAKYAPNGNYVWAIGAGGTDDDKSQDITLDDNGNIYMAGSFKATAQFDPAGSASALVSSGDKDLFLAKYRSGGSLAWALSAGSSTTDIANAVAIDSVGNVLLSGSFAGAVGFDPSNLSNTLTSLGSSDIFMACYDSLGYYSWAYSIGGTGEDESYGITSKGSTLYLAGSYESTMDIDPSSLTSTISSAGNKDIFMASYTISCLSVSTTNLKDTICKGDSYVLGSQTLRQAGSYTEVFNASNGCDSIVNLELAVDSVPVSVSRNATVLSAVPGVSGTPSYQWIDCDTQTEINGETNVDYTITANGNYAVVATLNGCSDTSACYSVFDFNMGEMQANKLIRMFPNPTSGESTVEAMEPLTLNIFNTRGQKVYSVALGAGKSVLSLEHLSAGIYYVHFSEKELPLKLLVTRP